jgi:protein-tyrosine phosphatase
MTAPWTPRRRNADDLFEVLVVCTANQCRSPMAEFLLKEKLTSLGIRWTVRSAGTQAVPGAAVHPLIVEVVAERGLQMLQHPARPLVASEVESADLVLTATVAHRQAVVAANVAALNKTFTLRQFARLCSVVELESPDRAMLGYDLLTGARVARSRFQPPRPGEDDIVDPMGGRIRQFRLCRDGVVAAIDDITRPLAEAPAPAASAVVPTEPRLAPGDDALPVPTPPTASRRRLVRRRLQARRP